MLITLGIIGPTLIVQKPRLNLLDLNELLENTEFKNNRAQNIV